MKTRTVNIIEDPCFYQYFDPADLSEMNCIELTKMLSLARREQRRLREKVFVRGIYYRKNAEALDKQNEKEVTRVRTLIEGELFDKQGYIPVNITDKLIHTMLKKRKNNIAHWEKQENGVSEKGFKRFSSI